MKVLGIDKNYVSRAVEIKEKNKKEIESSLKNKGWTNITFLSCKNKG